MDARNWRRLWSYALIVVAGLVTALVLGKDFNWDSLSYHFYAGFSGVENRLGADYFAASSQAYLTPYSHVPFYLMVKNGFAPQLVVAMLALFHLLNLLIVYEIAILINKRQDGTVAWPAVWVAVFLAFCNPVFFLELGNTFNEISTSVPVLAGWYLLIREFNAPRRSRIALAGLLIGLAVALKLTNLFFSVTALPLLLLAPASWKARAQSVLVFAAAGLLGFLLGGGWWAWQLWDMFGNPFFPLFNQFFHAPEFTDAVLKHHRFLPDSVGDVLFKPFMMVMPGSGIHLETMGPDMRYAALVLLLGLFGLKYAFASMQVGAWARRDPFPPFQGGRVLLALTLGVLLAWLVWVMSSGNSRYFLPMSSLASVVLASLLFRFSAQLRFVAYCTVPLVLLQAVTTVATSEHRWTPAGWGQAWFELDIPAQLQQEPALYMHLNAQPASFLLPYLPQGSSMINVTGQYVVDERSPKLQALLARHAGKVRVMRRFGGTEIEAKHFNYALVRFGMEVDMASCLDMKFLHRHPLTQVKRNAHFISCKTRPLQWSDAERDAFRASQRRANAVFDRLETVCPHLFQPRGLVNEGDGKQYWRNYVNTDTVLQQYESGLVTYRNVFVHTADVAVGQIEALEKAMPNKAAICP